jgi:hypothetical protein
MDFTSSVIRDLKNRTLTLYGHTEQMKQQSFPKNLLHWSPQERTGKGRPTSPLWMNRFLEGGD